MGWAFQYDDVVSWGGTAATYLSARDPYGLGCRYPLPQLGLWRMGRSGYGYGLTSGSRVPQRQKGVFSSKAAEAPRGH